MVAGMEAALSPPLLGPPSPTFPSPENQTVAAQTVSARPADRPFSIWRTADGMVGYLLLGVAFVLGPDPHTKLLPIFLISGPLSVAFTLPGLVVATQSLESSRTPTKLLRDLLEAVAEVGRFARGIIPIILLFMAAGHDRVGQVFFCCFAALGLLGLSRCLGAALPPADAPLETVLALLWTGLTGIVAIALYFAWMSGASV